MSETECIICYEAEDEFHPFMRRSYCQCTEINIHQCCAEMIRSKGRCPQCATALPRKPIFDESFKHNDDRTCYWKENSAGQKEGPYYEYTILPNGYYSMEVDGNYKNDEQHGSWKIWSPKTGRLIFDGNYINGEFSGQQKYMLADGSYNLLDTSVSPRVINIRPQSLSFNNV